MEICPRAKCEASPRKNPDDNDGETYINYISDQLGVVDRYSSDNAGRILLI